MTVLFVLSDSSIKAINYHPNMGNIQWFELDCESNFCTRTNATEKWVVEKLIELFSSVKKGREELFQNKIFSKWWKKSVYKMNS